MSIPIQSPELRFWPKVNKSPGLGPNGDCWEWQGACVGGGYGRFRTYRRAVYAHCFAYELLVGAIPEGLQLDHLCRVRRCVNPAHLEPVTPKENVVRGRSANREKEHCANGHVFDTANTYRWKGGRYCRECNKERAYQRYHARGGPQ